MLRKLKDKLWNFKEDIFGVILIIIACFLLYLPFKLDSTISQFLVLIGLIGLVIIVMRIIRPQDW